LHVSLSQTDHTKDIWAFKFCNSSRYKEICKACTALILWSTLEQYTTNKSCIEIVSMHRSSFQFAICEYAQGQIDIILLGGQNSEYDFLRMNKFEMNPKM